MRQVFRGRLVRVEVESWPHGEREVVRHPGACAAVPLAPSGEVILVRQLREAVRERLLEIPAGILDVGEEEPAACAAREVREETGYAAAAVEGLGTVYPSPGFTDERIWLFLVHTDPTPEGAPEEGLEVVRMPLAGAVAAVRQGRIVDAKTALALLLVWLRRSGP